MAQKLFGANLFKAVFISSIIGILLGWGIAFGFLTINGWQPELELKKYADNNESRITTTRTVTAQKENPNAKASIDITKHNFGVMDVKGEGFHDFSIRNDGTEDLVLSVNRTSCSCLGIDITPLRVAPGRTARARLRYTAERAMTGKFTQGGVVVTNDPDNKEIYLSVEGVFTNPVVVQPGTLFFARVPAGSTRTQTVKFYGFENEPLQLSQPAWTNKEYFDFHWESVPLPTVSESADSTADDDSYLSMAKSVIEGTITLKPGLPVGPFQDWFQIRTNSSQGNVSVTVRGEIVSGNVTISGQGYNRQIGNRQTGVVDLGRTTKGNRVSRELLIQFSGASALSSTVEVRTVEPSWLNVELSEPRDAGSRRMVPLKIEIPENAPTGSFVFGNDAQQAYIIMDTNDETMPVIRLPLQFSVGN